MIKLGKAVKQYHPKAIHLTGGVSANTLLRQLTKQLAGKHKIDFCHPTKLTYCTDNAAMIGCAAQHKLRSLPAQDWPWQDVDVCLDWELF